MSTNSPLVTVVIPAYNAAATLQDALTSVLSQTYSNIETIVVDDGSTDATRDIAKQYSGVTYIYQVNSGSCAAPRNMGVQHSHGEFIAFLDADDLMTPDRIAAQVDFLHRHPAVGVVVSNYANFTPQGLASKSHFETCPVLMCRMGGQEETVLDDANLLMLDEFFGIAGSFLVRRRLMEQVEGFPTQLRAGEDFYLLYRLAKIGPVGVIRKVGMMRRLHGANMSADFPRMNREGIKTCGLLLKDEDNLRARRLLKRRISTHYQDWGRHCANSREFTKAVSGYLRSIPYDPRLGTLLDASVGVIRSLAINAGLHKSAG